MDDSLPAFELSRPHQSTILELLMAGGETSHGQVISKSRSLSMAQHARRLSSMEEALFDPIIKQSGWVIHLRIVFPWWKKMR